MFRRASFVVVLFMWLIVGCGDQPTKQAPSKPKNRYFGLADSTQLALPPSFFLSENLNSEHQLVAEVYAHFLANLESPPNRVTFLGDSLSQNHHLAAYQMDATSYNQNMAALLNSKLSHDLQDFDSSHPCYSILKVESMQYASNEWNALKFKFKIDKKMAEEDSDDCKDAVEQSFFTVFYYNGQGKAYFFVEYDVQERDLDAVLRRVQL